MYKKYKINAYTEENGFCTFFIIAESLLSATALIKEKYHIKYIGAIQEESLKNHIYHIKKIRGK